VTEPIPSHVSHYSRADSLASLDVINPAFPPSKTAVVLRDPANDHLLGYTFAEASTHVFPGDHTGYGAACFFADLDAELRASPAFHLWAEVPLCRYRCHFCLVRVALADDIVEGLPRRDHPRAGRITPSNHTLDRRRPASLSTTGISATSVARARRAIATMARSGLLRVRSDSDDSELTITWTRDPPNTPCLFRTRRTAQS